MTFMSVLMGLFPLLHISGCVGLFFYALMERSYGALGLFFFVLYFLAPILFRFHNLIWPLKPGFVDISTKSYPPWFGSHQLQILYICVPALEAVLRAIPGAYSFWLRLWGAKIGKGVYWTPKIEILDRPLMIVGDKVVFGHLAVFCSHYVTPHKGKPCLYIAPIEIGAKAFVGASTRMGPGSKIVPGGFTKYNTECWPGKSYGQKDP